MSPPKQKERWELSDIEVSKSAVEAALNVVRRLTREKAELNAEWATAIRLAQANGASLREIAEVADVAPQTASKVAQGSSDRAHARRVSRS